jgi:hypothetical protein
MSPTDAIDPLQTHFEVLRLDENATLVRRQIEEEYEKRVRQHVQRLAKLDAASEEAETVRARIAQLNAAKAVLLPRKSRQEYADLLRRLRTAERDLAEATGKRTAGKSKEGSAVLILHLRQQIERVREELQRVHGEQYRRHANDHLGEAAPEAADDDLAAEDTGARRRVARAGERAAALAALAARPLVKRSQSVGRG